MQKRDYFERIIEQLANAVAKIMTLAAERKVEEAAAELEAAWSASLGIKRGDATRLDDVTLKSMLGAKATLGASLFEAEASIANTRGDTARAAHLRTRAALLRQ